MQQRRLLFVLVALAIAGMAAMILTRDATIPGVIIGAFIAVATTFVVEDWKRGQLRRDLAIVLHHELASRVARCYVDFEAPWSQRTRDVRVSKFDAMKFAPLSPLIYEANAAHLALFGDDAATALMSFYFRLSVLTRDIEVARAESGTVDLDPSFVPIIRSRFAATLQPGLVALETLGKEVAEWERIEANAFEPLKVPEIKRREGTLRDGLRAEIAAEMDRSANPA